MVQAMLTIYFLDTIIQVDHPDPLDPGRNDNLQNLQNKECFFLLAPPEFAKCWPVSNWFQKNLESQTGHIALEGPVR